MSDFSTPRQGIHSVRIPVLDIALVDTAATVGGAYVISKYMEWPFLYTTLGLFASSIAIHHIFKIDSKLHCSFMKLINHHEEGMCPNNN